MKSSRQQITELTTEMLSLKGKMDVQDILANMLGIMSSSYQEANDRHLLILTELQSIKSEIKSLQLLEKQVEDMQKKTDKLQNVQNYHTWVIGFLSVVGSITVYYVINFGLKQIFEPPIVSQNNQQIIEKP